MSGLDWVIVAFCLLLAMYGYVQGFIVGVLSLVGFGLGAFIGTRIGPLLLPGGSQSRYAPLFGLFGALLAGAVLASGLEGVGLYARRALRLPGLRTLDGVLGAAFTACVGLGIAWILGAVALQSTNSRQLRADIQRSAILRELNQVLPPSGAILHALARFDPLPAVQGPQANVPPPSRAILRSPGVRAARAGVVRVLGTACGLGVEGSGWFAGSDLVVTNAHVVAGESDTTVELGGGPPGRPVQLLAFDPHDDIAVLRVLGVSETPLSIVSSPASGTSAAVLGYPLNGPFDAEAARIGQTEAVSTEDAYGNGPVLRSVETLRGLVRPGNSGGPVIDSSGRVLGTVFAATTGASRNGSGGFAVPNELVRAQLDIARSRHHPVSSGPCAG